MKITVIVCTYNRCTSLAKALNSVAASRLPESFEWEVLVVDNNSRDQTREVVEHFCRRHPRRFRYLFESQQGKSFALNAGIHEARGDVLAFMDDDVTVDSMWARNLTAHLHNGEWAGAGGRILPAHDFSPPPWLPLDGPRNMSGVLALFDFGDKTYALDRAPLGTNMAFQKKMFGKYGGFRTDLGPSPGSEIRNEDTEFGRRLLAAGERLRYEPSAIVYHPVYEERLKKEYFRAFWFDLGRATIREAGKRPDIWSIPRHYLTMLKAVTLLGPARTLRWMFASNPKLRFYHKCWVWKTGGEIVEIYRQSHDARGHKDNKLMK
jgi:glycosyltransferase involved in cell wall biosynthesis